MGEYLQKAYLDRLEKEHRKQEHKKGLELNKELNKESSGLYAEIEIADLKNAKPLTLEDIKKYINNIILTQQKGNKQ